MRALRIPLAISLAVVSALVFYASRYDRPPGTRTFLDRGGEIVGTLDPSYLGIQHWTPWDRIPPALIEMTVASEDRFFFRHRGINPVSLLKAGWENLLARRVVRGGSTITQQLAKNLIQERACRNSGDCVPAPRSWSNKLLESLLALGLEMKHGKTWILERYLNTVYYGRRSYGAAAAARSYFGKDLEDLTKDEIAFLAARPKAPSRSAPAKPDASLQSEGDTALPPMASHLFFRPKVARHFLEYVSRFLSDDSPIVQTTLDLDLQTRLEAATARLLADPASDDPLLNAAVVVIDVKTGDLLALVGSRDYFGDAISGRVNAATALRQPGSTLKPFTYFAAFAKGYRPDSIVPDEPFSFQAVGHLGDEAGDGYAPQNFDRRYHGPLTIREALANSYNIPAVVTLNEIGLSYYHDLLRKFGFSSLRRPPPYYGLSVTLGSGEVSLLELTNAYAALARGGAYAPYAFVRNPRRGGQRVVPVAADAGRLAGLVTGILSDPEARLKAFGYNGHMTVEGHDVAVKTGTSYEHRDNWTVGYTPSFAVGVWVGHSDGSPMEGAQGAPPTTGASGAAPLWHAAMEALLRGRPPEKFPRPSSLPSRSLPEPAVRGPDRPWRVLSPVPNTTYRLSRWVPAEHQKIAGLAHVAPNGKDGPVSLSWYLDGTFLDSTEGPGRARPVWIRPTPGRHTLSVVSSTGEKQDIRFRVMDSENL